MAHDSTDKVNIINEIKYQMVIFWALRTSESSLQAANNARPSTESAHPPEIFSEFHKAHPN